MRELRPFLVPDSAGGDARYCRYHGARVCHARPCRDGHGPAGSAIARDSKSSSSRPRADPTGRHRRRAGCARPAGSSNIHSRPRRQCCGASGHAGARSILVSRSAGCGRRARRSGGAFSDARGRWRPWRHASTTHCDGCGRRAGPGANAGASHAARSQWRARGCGHGSPIDPWSGRRQSCG